MKSFAPFRLDPVNQCLWRRADTEQEERVLLTPKAFSVLTYLVNHAGRLVTHDELLNSVWSRTVVEPQTVKKHIVEVRTALGDRPKNSLFIETLPRRGYRFVAAVSESVASAPIVAGRTGPSTLVGRGGALEELHEAWQHVAHGERQIVFITGEPGIGKSALAEVFRQQAALTEKSVRIAHGQCIETYGNKEAYGPMLEALGRLCRGPRAEPIVRTLLAEAPTWVTQLPALLTHENREMLHREIQGATRERMLRELGEALESITAETPLLLVLEDLQWVDDSSVDLIATLTRRRSPAKLMLLATCRSFELCAPSMRALIPDLLVHQLCRKIELTRLSETEVEKYLTDRSPSSLPPAGLSALVHRHCDGNPLFMVAALEHMKKRGFLTNANGRWELQIPLAQIEFEVPDDLRHMIEAQLERVSEKEQNALELASVAGASFSARLLSGVAETEARDLEDLYEELSRRHHIVKWVGTQSFPDGSAAERYEFVHALYRQVLYERQLHGRRARLHRLIGEHLATLHARDIEEVVPELAYHFEQAGEWPRAIEYLQCAADITGRRYAHQQADSMLTRALELVINLPEAQRVRTEPQLLALLAAHRWAVWDVRVIETLEHLVARAADYGLIDIQARALVDLSFFLSLISAERCLEAVQRALRLSAQQDPAMRTRTRTACAFRRLSVSGWSAYDALEFREGLAELGRHGLPASVADLVDESFIRLTCGEYREARRVALEARTKLLELGANPDSRIEYEIGSALAAFSLIFLGEWAEALEEYAVAIASATRNANYHYLQWLLAQQAWLHFQAMDFKGVRAICESALSLTRNSALRPAPGWPIGFPRQVRNALICSALASVALGDYARALEDFSTLNREMDRQTVFFDWYWRMPAAAGMTELWLATGDRSRAQQEAGRFLEISLATADRHWQGLAWEVNSRVALENLDLPRAQDCIAEALTIVQGFEVPLAAWRVHATAAHIDEESGNHAAASAHREVSRVTILRLANSLSEQEPLRKSFLSAHAVARILNGPTSRN
jgi:DNA-binding winged helix-turn-helix (wHTH) protein/tetratricopeptide (TPR) repeat protein